VKSSPVPVPSNPGATPPGFGAAAPGRPTGVPLRRLLADRVAPLPAAAFTVLARRRRGAPVHHHGVGLAGELALTPRAGPVGAALLDRPGRYRVRARVSWGVARAGLLPDIPGLALRVVDAGTRGGAQDLLLDGSLPPPRDRVLMLRRDLAGWFGTPLRLRLGGPGGDKVQVAVRLDAGPGRLTLAGLPAAVAAGRLRGLLVVHDAGRLLATGRLHFGAVDSTDPARPRFDVGVDAGGLVGTGFWHLLRVRSYAAARAADPRLLLGRDQHPEHDVDHDLRAGQQAGQQEEHPHAGG
jgi:hypothetical protein